MSHRISIDIGNNEFLTEQPDGTVYGTFVQVCFPASCLTFAVAVEFQYHRENGFSPNCVICRDEARHALPAAPAATGSTEAELAEAYAMNEEHTEAMRLTVKFKLPGYEKFTPAAAGADVTEMRSRFAMLEASLDEPISRERADQVMLELVDLQAEIEKADGKMDEWADGREMMRGGNLSDGQD